MVKMKCINCKYETFQAGEVYEFKETGKRGRFRVFEYTDSNGHVYTFGLDPNLENNCEQNYMKFAEI